MVCSDCIIGSVVMMLLLLLTILFSIIGWIVCSSVIGVSNRFNLFVSSVTFS